MYNFSSHFGELEHVFVCHIWIMDIKCLVNSISVYIKRPNEPWITLNFSTDIMSFHVARGRKYKAKRGSDYVSPTRGTHFPIGTTRLLWEKLQFFKWFVIKLGPNWTMFYHNIYVPWHDTMPTFMIFWWVLDLWRFKNWDSQCLRTSQDVETVVIHSHSLHGT